MITQKLCRYRKLLRTKVKVRIVYDVPFGIFVLVETKQSSTVSQTGEYLAGMAAAAANVTSTYVPSGRIFIPSTLGINSTGI